MGPTVTLRHSGNAVVTTRRTSCDSGMIHIYRTNQHHHSTRQFELNSPDPGLLCVRGNRACSEDPQLSLFISTENNNMPRVPNLRVCSPRSDVATSLANEDLGLHGRQRCH